LLALREADFGNFSVDSLVGDTNERSTDGQKIYKAIESNLDRANVSPQVKKDKLLSQFSVIRDNTLINEINDTLGKTPLKHYTEFLQKRVYQNIRYNRDGEDYLGRFYGEFMSYSGGDGQTLGIILTPKHITNLFCDLLDLKPTDRVFDPCCGSGHILVYAFDVLMQIYESYGYSQRDAAKSIVENNLYGLDIDNRAYQLAYFAVMMKARQYNRRILTGETNCHFYAIQESNDINRNQLKYFGAGLSEMEKNTARLQLQGLLDTFIDAKEYGSILSVENYNWELLRKFIKVIDEDGQMSLDTVGIENTRNQLDLLIEIGEAMAQKYDVVATNPPYMGSRGMSGKLTEYVKKNFFDSKSDLFAVFIEKCTQMTKLNGYQAMITQHAFMFLSSFENLRKKILLSDYINMAHLGARAFEEIGGEVVQTTSFVMRNSHINNYKGSYLRLIDPITQSGKEEMFLSGQNRYTTIQCNFSQIPGSPIAYWASDKFISAYERGISIEKISDYTDLKIRLPTINNI
jgi:hypothetical protein